MAKLGSYYGLCPLIDQKSLLGVSQDADPGFVVITLGRNMAIKYKLSDQKQIQSWSTKEKLSSPVIFDRQKNNYVAVFNHYFLRYWSEFENIEKVKKIKFSVALHTIISCENETIAIFKNGNVLTLSHAVEIRKNIPENDIIDSAKTIADETCLKIEEKYYVGMLLKKKETYSYLWISPSATVNDESNKASIKIELKRDVSHVKLLGHLTMVTDSGPALFVLWSDGRLFKYSLSSEDNTGHFYSVIESLSRKNSVSMVPLNNNYIAMYGADTNQEGASLQIFNMQFKVTQSKQQFKLYTEGSKLWLIANSLILTVGQNLAVVPFHLATEQLAALVGSHKLTSVADDEDIAVVTEMVIENWDEPKRKAETVTEITVASVKNKYAELVKEGWPESGICEEIYPKLMDQNNNTIILHSLDYFMDIPESILVTLLSYSFLQISNNSDSDIVNKGISADLVHLVDKLLSLSYSEVLLLPNLRTHLKFNEALSLLQYLCYLLSENGHSLLSLDVIASENKIIDWVCLMLDAYYQQLLLSKDIKIAENIEYLKTLINTYMQCMDNYSKFEAILRQMTKKKENKKLLNMASLKYSIENIKLY